MRFALSLLALAFLAPIAGCKNKVPPKTNFMGELPPGMVALRKIKPPEPLPDFSNCGWNLNILPAAIDHSIAYMEHPGSRGGFPYLDITHDRAMATLRAFREIVDQAKTQPNPGQYIDQQIKARFEVYKSIGAPNPEGAGFTEKVLFTGYCTPIYDASLKREGPYQWPIYKKPGDLKLDPVTGETAAPYYTRREIEQGKLAGQELAFFKTRWEAYKVTINGSAVLNLPNGQRFEVGFAGQNGHEYVSPSDAMIKDGVFTKEQRNNATMAAYFDAHPEMAEKYLWMNNRTVFFKERPGGPFGAPNQQVTNWATIATDKTLDQQVKMSVYPRAMPAFLNVAMTNQPDKHWNLFMMDQDTGGAIRAAGRCDVYMGIGPEAEAQAGQQYSEGELFYIALKPELVPQYLNGPHQATRPVR